MKIVRILIIALFLLPEVAMATEAGQILGSGELAKVFGKYVVELSPWPAEDIEIWSFKARPAELDLPEGKIEYRMNGAFPNSHPGYKSLEVIVSVKGKDLARVRMSGELHLFANVVCTNKKMRRGDVVEDGDVSMIRTDLTWQSQGVIFKQGQATGKKLKNSLRAGALLLERHLEERPLVHRGDSVKIVAGKPPLNVSVPGRVRDKGAAGDLVRVKNMMSRKILLARVLDDRTVVVDY